MGGNSNDMQECISVPASEDPGHHEPNASTLGDEADKNWAPSTEPRSYSRVGWKNTTACVMNAMG